MHFLINHSVSQKVTLIAWYCTEICELFISVGSRFCAGCVNCITLYSVTYGVITEEPVVVDKQYTGGILYWSPRTWQCTPIDIFLPMCFYLRLIRVKSWWILELCYISYNQYLSNSNASFLNVLSKDKGFGKRLWIYNKITLGISWLVSTKLFRLKAHGPGSWVPEAK